MDFFCNYRFNSMAKLGALLQWIPINMHILIATWIWGRFQWYIWTDIRSMQNTINSSVKTDPSLHLTFWFCGSSFSQSPFFREVNHLLIKVQSQIFHLSRKKETSTFILQLSSQFCDHLPCVLFSGKCKILCTCSDCLQDQLSIHGMY
jgi:hypothetical protein